MIPLGDDRLQNGKTPVANVLLILINIAVFIHEIQLEPEALNVFIGKYAAIPSLIGQGQNLQSLFTCMFLHGGWLHLLGNMLFLWIFGDNIESALGHVGYLIFYLLGGLVASVAHVAANWGDAMPSLGASGAISAAMGACIIMFPRSHIRTLIPLLFFFTTIRLSAWIFIGIWIVIQVLSSTAQQTTANGGVAWWAHIGGFAFGLLVGIIFRGRAKALIAGPVETPRRWM